jgi:hypothetical protein
VQFCIFWLDPATLCLAGGRQVVYAVRVPKRLCRGDNRRQKHKNRNSMEDEARLHRISSSTSLKLGRCGSIDSD